MPQAAHLQMVKVSPGLLLRSTSSNNKKREDESFENFMSKITHLYMNNKNIDDVGDTFRHCSRLQVLYLYENKLTSVPDLSANSNLTHLYLQQNNITRICGLERLVSLEKLFLSKNKISVLEGMECQKNLRELHIDHQRLAAGEEIIVDPRSTQSLRSLRNLDISGSSLSCLEGLVHLTSLEHLDLSSNRLTNESELLNYLSQTTTLKDLSIAGNPLSKISRMNEKIILSARTLGMDNINIQYLFLRNPRWKRNLSLTSKIY
ncbi:unnamed protein product [Hymenolepis diminuta]|uniref:Protein phosphatase 1 regulatory subunit 42 n=1 Tax=Hymenolepis diminuta TaxID=6216 RepID=A0A3P6ZKC1_HYMDI|nr:unnamed protein product [Hymenolepis diminuta]